MRLSLTRCSIAILSFAAFGLPCDSLAQPPSGESPSPPPRTPRPIGGGFPTAPTTVSPPAAPGTGTPQRGIAKPGGNRRLRTMLTLEILHEGRLNGVAGAQSWQHAFAKMGRSVRFRSPRFQEKPEIKESKRGTLRFLTVIGAMGRQGQIVFPDGKTFKKGDALKLDEWLRSLETYGAQGDPEGKPLWGLSKTQFDIVFAALKKPTTIDTADKPLHTVLEELPLPESLPIRMSTATEDWLKSEFPTLPNVRQNLKGTSLGTTLAILLNNYGLGLKPLRTPESTIELVVDPLRGSKLVWPVGWEPKGTVQPLAPKLYKIVAVNLSDAKLLDVLPAIQEQIEIPIYLDYYRPLAKGIDLETLTVNLPDRRTTYSIALRSLTTPYRLKRKIVLDDAGKPFVWISTIEIRRATP